jgi:uncharacterized membrane protein
MADTNGPRPILSAHVEETVQSIAQLQAEHREKATPAPDHMTDLLGRPQFTIVLTVIVVAWISLNIFTAALDYRPIDSPPFSWPAGAVSLVSLYMVVLILATQRREDQLGRRRELLILELAILSEQKTAKVIELLEEVRRDDPLIHNRVDQEAEVMPHGRELPRLRASRSLLRRMPQDPLLRRAEVGSEGSRRGGCHSQSPSFAQAA